MRPKRCLLHSPLVGHQVQENGLRAHPRPWKWKELGPTERRGRPNRKTAFGTSGTQSKAMKAQKRRMEKKKELEKTQRKSDEW